MPPPSNAMSAPVAELWSVLYRETVWLHGRWIMYRQLFGTSQERIDVLNQSAGTFFQVLSQTLLHEIQLSLSKLGDPAETRSKRKNLTLRALQNAISESTQASQFNIHVATYLDRFDGACEQIRLRRNTWIAHFDLATMLESTVTPLEGPSRSEIELALAALRDLMNSVEFYYSGGTTAYELFAITADGNALVSVLMQGLRYQQLVKEKVIAHDDLRNILRGVA
jgi:AbiU2